MTWFKVDDGMHKNRKRVRVGITPDGFAAMGLWVVAGSWSADELTEGFVPDDVLDYLAPGVGKDMATRLERAGLWYRHARDGEDGWQFHDWEDYQPSRDEVLAANAKKASGGKLGNHRRWHVDTGKRDPRCAYCTNQSSDRSSDRSTDRPSDRVSDRSSESGPSRPSRPDPTRPGPSSSNSKSGGVDLSGSLPKQDQSEVSKTAPAVDESELPYHQRHRKRWCDEHGHPDDRDCPGCFSVHGDQGYWSKRPEGAYKAQAAKSAAGGA